MNKTIATIAKVAAATTLLLAGYALFCSLPDLRRYIRMSSMWFPVFRSYHSRPCATRREYRVFGSSLQIVHDWWLDSWTGKVRELISVPTSSRGLAMRLAWAV